MRSASARIAGTRVSLVDTNPARAALARHLGLIWAGDDAEPLAARGPFPQFGPVFPLQQRVQVQAEGELDGFAGRPRGRDDDDPAARMTSGCVSTASPGSTSAR